MGMPLGWQVATTAAVWLQEAIKAARNRRQQRFAHIVENAGIIVAGLRSIDREFRRLFLPLRYFDPQGWPEDKRREWAERIITLTSEDVLVPRMRVADSALETLAAEEKDSEVRALIRSIRFASEPIKGQSSTGELLDAVVSEDYKAQGSVPDIIGLLLGQDPDAGRINSIAENMLRDSALPHMADSAEQNFGYLLGRQQQVFPALPAPTWVWDHDDSVRPS